MQLHELLFRRTALSGSLDHLCVCSSPHREHRKAQLSRKAAHQTRCRTIWLYSFVPYKQRGKSRKRHKVQGPCSMREKKNAKGWGSRWFLGHTQELQLSSAWKLDDLLLVAYSWFCFKREQEYHQGVAYCRLQFSDAWAQADNSKPML